MGGTSAGGFGHNPNRDTTNTTKNTSHNNANNGELNNKPHHLP